MARQAVLFRRRKFHQTLPGAGEVWSVTILTSHGGHRGCFQFRRLVASQRIGDRRSHGLAGKRMRRALPAGNIVAGQAQSRARIIHHQEIAELIIMRVVARGALQTAIVIQFNFAGQGGGVFDLRIFRRQCGVIHKRNGMIAR